MAFLALSLAGQEKYVFLVFAEEYCVDLPGLVAKTWCHGLLDGVNLDRGGLTNSCWAAGDQRHEGNQGLGQIWEVGVSHCYSQPLADGRKPSCFFDEKPLAANFSFLWLVKSSWR